MVADAAGLVIWRQIAPNTPATRGPAVEDVESMLPSELATIARGTGPVALVEFADFQCPFCGRHAREVGPLIQKAFIDTGVVRHVFVNYPLARHTHAEPAGEAALCAGRQGRFWEMHEALFQNQALLGEELFANRAREIGLDMPTFSRCVDGDEAEGDLALHKSIARKLGVQSTPAFFVGIVQPNSSVALMKRINGAAPFADFRSVIVEAIPPALKERVDEVALRE